MRFVVLIACITKTKLKCFQIIFHDRKVRQDHDTHLSVDGVDCRIPQKGRAFASHKFKKKSAFRYEVAVGILTGEIKWINGPFPAGTWTDLTIFRSSLMQNLDVGELVEADDGYSAESPWVTRTPAAVLTRRTPEDDALQMRLQGRHETINARLKRFEILNEPFRHDCTQHGGCFGQLQYLCNFR